MMQLNKNRGYVNEKQKHYLLSLLEPDPVADIRYPLLIMTDGESIALKIHFKLNLCLEKLLRTPRESDYHMNSEIRTSM